MYIKGCHYESLGELLDLGMFFTGV